MIRGDPQVPDACLANFPCRRRSLSFAQVWNVQWRPSRDRREAIHEGPMGRNHNADDDFLTIPECAKIAKISERTIWRAIADGELKAYKIRGCTRVRRGDLMDWLRAKRR